MYMLSRAWSGAVRGIEGYLVQVEVFLTQGTPGIHTVGLPDSAVREARERVKAAITNNGFKFPKWKAIVNLAPADVRKHGSAFDLAVAAGILAAERGGSGNGNDRLRSRLENILLLGELALDGDVRPARGTLSITVEAKTRGLQAILVPKSNFREATLVQGMDVYPVGSLREAIDLLESEELPPPVSPIAGPTRPGTCPISSEVKGQFVARRAIEIAAAGGHNLLLSGPPGAGKTLLARRMPSILPELGFEDALEVTKVHSVAGRLSGNGALLTNPPFRAPHHTASWAAMAGGGIGPMPGEVSLAHGGVLFLDELAEFARGTLESLRQPLEDGSIVISRVGSSVCYPAKFIMVAAMNPCPCGYLGAESRPCTCTPQMVNRYRSRVSGPLLDRVDLHVFVRPLPADELMGPLVAESSSSVRLRVLAARANATETISAERSSRERRHDSSPNNALLPSRSGWAPALRQAIGRLGLSARAYHRIIKVARTIADLGGQEALTETHLQEAIQYRIFEAQSFGSNKILSRTQSSEPRTQEWNLGGRFASHKVSPPSTGISWAPFKTFR